MVNERKTKAKKATKRKRGGRIPEEAWADVVPIDVATQRARRLRAARPRDAFVLCARALAARARGAVVQDVWLANQLRHVGRVAMSPPVPETIVDHLRIIFVGSAASFIVRDEMPMSQRKTADLDTFELNDEALDRALELLADVFPGDDRRAEHLIDEEWAATVRFVQRNYDEIARLAAELQKTSYLDGAAFRDALSWEAPPKKKTRKKR